MKGVPRKFRSDRTPYSFVNDINVGAEYDADEIEFMMAMEKYKRERRRQFPTWSEVLEVVKILGYRKPDGE